MTFTHDAEALTPHPVTRRGSQRTNRVVALSLTSVLVAGTILGSGQAARATDYPSFADVQNAQRSEQAKETEIVQVNTLLDQLQTAVTTANAIAAQRGAEAQKAQSRLDDATARAEKLRSQADDAKAKADASRNQAGQVAARLSLSGGSDLSTNLFFSGSNADNVLSQLGLESMIKDQSAGLYEKAVQDENTAKSMTNQADVAKVAIKALSDVAQKALLDAAAAVQVANAAVSDQQAHQVELNAQLAILASNETVTAAAYATGVQVAKAAAAAARAAQLAAAPHGGQIASSGWALPAGGHISSPYGYRIDPYNGIYALHEGTDLAPGCGAPIYAAHSGTVILAGPYGGYGNYVRIRNDGDGSYWTAYGHIVNGGILVGIGDHVSVGQNIARVGSTGWSTGCHLHFEVYHNGTTEDPVPYMRSQGVTLG